MSRDADGRRRRMGRALRKLDDDFLGHAWEPDGIELAPPELRPMITTKALRRRFAAPMVVRPEDFMPIEEARAVLQRRLAPWPSYKHAVADGLVRVAFRSVDGEEGLTRDSVGAEVRWREQASLLARLSRRLRLMARI